MNKTIKKITYKNNHYYESQRDKYEKQWTIDSETTKKFNKDGRCVEIYKEKNWGNLNMDSFTLGMGSGIGGITTIFTYDNLGNYTKKEWFSSLKSEITTYHNKYDSRENLIGYEENTKKYDNPIIRNDETLEEKYSTVCEIVIEYDEKNLLTKSRQIKYGSDQFVFDELIIENIYDHSDELIKKKKERIDQSKDGEFFNHEVEQYKYYFDDKGEKVEQQDYFSTRKKETELSFSGKIIKKYNEKIHFGKNNEPSQKWLFTYNDEGLKVKEEHLIGEKIHYLSKYEYVNHKG
jgi:hypothetical protein